MFSTVLDILIQYHTGFLSGLAVTLQLCAIIWSLGIILGSALGFFGWQYPDSVGKVSRIISFILAGIPILVFLFWLHYPVQAIFEVVIDPFYTAAFTFTIVNIFGVADLVRFALEDFPQQYLFAARVCGLPHKKTIFKIQLPILFRQVLPGLLMLQVTMLHVTLFSSLISVEEIFRVAQRINAQIYKPVEIYTALGIFFLMVCLPVNGVAVWIKNKYTRNLSDR
ncbi:MAG: ABC transporter permease subunit [Alphaproteobacteria bacterium]|nr:MAG: ABC transporter permease subunit [Alphaproteobacteria bacterium]